MSPSTTHWARRSRAAETTQPAGIRTELLRGEELLSVVPSADDLASARPWSARVTSAALRRVRRLIHTLRCRPPAAEAALQWLEKSAPVGSKAAGLPACSGQFDPCPGLTAGVLATMASYGQYPLVRRLADWLTSVQMPDGAFPDAGLRRASALNTAHAAQGLMTAAELTRDPELRQALDSMAERACRYLAGSIERRGAIAGASSKGTGTKSFTNIAHLAPLATGAVRFGEPKWGAAIDGARGGLARALDGVAWQAPLHVMLPGVETLVELGETALVRPALDQLAAAQRRDGAVPALPGAGWVSTTGIAQLANLWYRMNERGRADRAMNWLRRRQEKSGGFLGSYGRGACYYPRREVAWATKYFLDASLRQVEATFAGAAANRLRGWIEPSDGRLQAVVAWCAMFGVGARVADVGCGRGRYLESLCEQFPHLRFSGVDPARSCLAQLPPTVDAIHGGMPNLPLDDACLDGTMAIESLEHCLAPERGVAELCRAVRPGGRVLVIDKQRSHQPLSHCEPWERWFTRDEVSGWLARHCDDVKCFSVPHAEHSQPTGLFLCWTGTRRL